MSESHHLCFSQSVSSVQFGWRVQLPRFRVGIITTGVFGSEGTERRAQITYSEVFK